MRRQICHNQDVGTELTADRKDILENPDVLQEWLFHSKISVTVIQAVTETGIPEKFQQHLNQTEQEIPLHFLPEPT